MDKKNSDINKSFLNLLEIMTSLRDPKSGCEWDKAQDSYSIRKYCIEEAYEVVYQSYVTSSKGWGEFTIAQSFMSYSIFTVSTLLLAGPLIDKFSSRKLLIYMNIPLLISTFVIILFDSSVTAFVFLGLIGISNGFANVLGSATWAEIYGVKHIGSIKALTTALMVFSTAFGTALFGVLIDIGF